VETRLEEDNINTGRRKKTEDVDYVGKRKKPYGMYWRSETIRSELEIEKFMGEDGKGLELMKIIERARKREERDRREKIFVNERLWYGIILF